MGPVLVTGAGGFAGSHLVEHLAGCHDVVAWMRSDPPESVARLGRWERIDLRDHARVCSAIDALRPSHVFHCAGSPHVAGSWDSWVVPLETNVRITHHVLDALRRAGSGARVLLTGSAHVYAPSPEPIAEDDLVTPASPYALSKVAQETLGLRAVVEDGLEVIVARSFNHTGPRQSAAFAAAAFARQVARIERGEQPAVIRVGNLDAQRDLTDVRDVVRAYALLLESGACGTVYNVASETARPIRWVLDELVARSRVPLRIETDPARLRPSDVPILVGDASRLRAATGWAPTVPPERMIDDLLEYWRSVG